jgi:hypothetical protein
MPARNVLDPHAGLLPLRTALIALIAVLIGLTVGALTLMTTASLPTAALAGLASAGGAVLPLDRVIGR